VTKPVVLIGAGPAGLACAARLSAAGRPVWVIDDNPQAGGQYFRQLPPGYAMASGARLQRETERARLLLEAVRSPSVRYLPGTIAWAAPSSLTIAYAGPGGSGRVEAAALVLATGAQDRPMPFPGWTLPGVITAGGCLNLAKGHGLVPSGRVVVAGNGPLLLVAAATLALAGCTLTHVVEARPTARLAAGLRDGLLLSPKLLLKGVRYRAALLRRGVRFLSGRMVARAMGDESLVAVEVAPVGADGQPNRSAATTLKAETLVVGYGLQPGSEFARMLGCTMRPRARSRRVGSGPLS
jgi:NADPH-dependent 2,4-dienoyl-CoA reductase/sulfur reductase-like enzyme